jgi:hypothetical protein
MRPDSLLIALNAKAILTGSLIEAPVMSVDLVVSQMRR